MTVCLCDSSDIICILEAGESTTKTAIGICAERSLTTGLPYLNVMPYGFARYMCVFM